MSADTAPAELFWLLTGEVPVGPFTVAQVHAELAAGRATWGTRACRVGGSAWHPLVHTPGIGPTVPPQIAADTHELNASLSSHPAASASSPNESAAGSFVGMFAAKSPASTNPSKEAIDAASPVAPFAPAAAHQNQTPRTTANSTEKGQNQPNRFWLLVGVETTGPFRAAHIRAKIQAGELRPEAKARRVGTEDWVSLTEAIGALPPRLSTGTKVSPANDAAAAEVPARQQKLDVPAPAARSSVTPIEVRCNCGQVVRAEEQFAGRHVQCPHCKGAVAVPVAAATAVSVAAATAPPAPKETPLDGAAMIAGGAIGLVILSACSDALPAGLVKMFAIGGVLAIVSGIAVLFGGRGVGPFR